MAKNSRFYLIVCGAVAAVIALGLIIFFTTRGGSKHEGPGIGLEFKPMPLETGSTFIYFDPSDITTYEYWVASLKELLKPYKDPGLTPDGGSYLMNCDYDLPPPSGKVCAVNVRQFGPCVEENSFGYREGNPCVFLNLEKIPGWTPEFYNTTESLETIQKDGKMPSELQEKIKGLINEKSPRVNTVWVTCEGENAADKENLEPLRYYPDQGFPGYYYPYRKGEGFLNPLVAVQFRNLPSGIVVNIQCKAWARNLKHNTVDNIGFAHFELLHN